MEPAQNRQKKAYDRKAKDHHFQIVDRVMIHMPGTVTGKSWKLARPYHGPYRVLNVTPTNVEARLVDDVDADSIFVAIDCVRLCPDSLPNDVWRGNTKCKRKRRSLQQTNSDSQPVRREGPITRPMTAAGED